MKNILLLYLELYNVRIKLTRRASFSVGVIVFRDNSNIL